MEKNKNSKKNGSGKISKNDFIKIKYIGKEKDGEIFDTNISKEAKKIDMDIKTRPLTICIGQGMILQGIDEFLIGKKTNESYTLDLKPKDAFGERERELVKTMPISVFRKHNINPRPGKVFSFDNKIGRVSAVSGGRIMVDFNNPMAGKEVVYEIDVGDKIKERKEKVNILLQTFFRKKFPFDIKDNELIIKADKKFKDFLMQFKNKFKEILNLDLKIQEKEDKKDKKEVKD